MEKFERFPEEKNASLRARYRGDDLFRNVDMAPLFAGTAIERTECRGNME